MLYCILCQVVSSVKSPGTQSDLRPYSFLVIKEAENGNHCNFKKLKAFLESNLIMKFKANCK